MREDILALLYAAMDEVDPLTVGGDPVAKTPDAGLLGSDAGVDSLTFVNIVVAIEDQIHKKLGKSVVLVDEDNMALDEHPFRTIGTMADYVERVLNKK